MSRARDARGVLIDASNLRVGGGLQVAASVLDELADLALDPDVTATFPWFPGDMIVEASPDVLSNCGPGVSRLDVVRTSRSWWQALDPRRPFKYFAVSFTIFGPEYSRSRARRMICGFADGTRLFSRPPGLPRRSTFAVLRSFVRRVASRRIFAGEHVLVVEAEHVRRELVHKWRWSPEQIAVVPNTYNAVFDDKSRWESPNLPISTSGKERVCYVTRGYDHKNIDFLGVVGIVLAEVHGIEVEFVLTLTEEEWAARSQQLRDHSVNVGPMTVSQLPRLYQQCTASIFPSLLECFSATPLESMAAGTPVIASNRAFVSEICGTAARYFDPYAPTAAADVLADVLTNDAERSEMSVAGMTIANSWPTGRDRAIGYLTLIHEQLHQQGAAARSGDSPG